MVPALCGQTLQTRQPARIGLGAKVVDQGGCPVLDYTPWVSEAPVAARIAKG
jgi:hypothetical protein